MGKKSSSNGGEKSRAARAFGLKVAMHCNCKGCIDKIRNAVKDLALVHGVEKVDQSALETKGEVSLVATADPEKLRQRLHKATRKNVVILLPKAETKPADRKDDHAAAAAAQAQALLGLHAPPAPYVQGTWANQLLGPGGGWNYGHGAPAAAQAQGCPWAVQPEAYLYSSYPAAAAATWEPYAYPPAAQIHGHGTYGGASAWHTHGHGY